MNGATTVYVAKAARVFVFGLVSIMMPVYLATLGYSPPSVGLVIAAMVGGSAISNIALVRYERRIGRRRFLVFFSTLMFGSGALLFVSSSYPVILVACLIGNISTTGTEAGPFQSVEVGALPNLVTPAMQNRGFGLYNMVGYAASSLGAFASSAPSYFQNSLLIFRLLFLLFGLVGLLLFALYRNMEGLDLQQSAWAGASGQELAPGTRKEITKLSALFSIDAFGGGFVSQSLLAYWFYLVYGISLGALGVIFLIVNVITAFSTLGASYIAEKIGNLRTMVYTHLLSNVFLVLIPLVGSLPGALFLLFARQSVSQMDVPTRQAFMAGMFDDRERVPAYAATNISRIVSGIPGSPASGILLAGGLASAPLLIAGLSKMLYDGLVFYAYRRKG